MSWSFLFGERLCFLNCLVAMPGNDAIRKLFFGLRRLFAGKSNHVSIDINRRADLRITEACFTGMGQGCNQAGTW